VDTYRRRACGTHTPETHGISALNRLSPSTGAAGHPAPSVGGARARRHRARPLESAGGGSLSGTQPPAGSPSRSRPRRPPLAPEARRCCPPPRMCSPAQFCMRNVAVCCEELCPAQPSSPARLMLLGCRAGGAAQAHAERIEGRRAPLVRQSRDTDDTRPRSAPRTHLEGTALRLRHRPRPSETRYRLVLTSVPMMGNRVYISAQSHHQRWLVRARNGARRAHIAPYARTRVREQPVQ